MMTQSEDVPTKILPLILIVTALCVPGVAKTRHSANHKTNFGSGCIERGVENSCHVIIDCQTGETYNLKFRTMMTRAPEMPSEFRARSMEAEND